MSKESLSRKITVSLVLLCAISVSAVAEVRLPALFSDHMVLQQGRPIPIWGWAAAGEEITVRLRDQVAQSKADGQGLWVLWLESEGAGGPFDLQVEGTNQVTVEDVFIGEVWICSGQSNMEWKVNRSNNVEREKRDANWPAIRMFTVQKKVSESPETDVVGEWKLCSPETVGEFSAVGYFFGRKIHKELDVPVGLLHTSWGGTPAEAWTSLDTLRADSDFVPIVERFEEAVKVFPRKKAEYETALKRWEEQDPAERARQPQSPFGPGHSNSPSGLYNAMLYPLAPYAIQGAIWYQGETNASRGHQYRKVLSSMISDWRNLWGQGDFPFGIVQLANFREILPEPAESDWAELREAQAEVASALPNAGLAVTIDIGEAEDIHPRNKQDVGRRLALWALKETYGRDVAYSGPTYQSMKIVGNEAIVSFSDTADGLAVRGDSELKGFSIAGPDREFVWAKARIDGKKVVVWSDSVDHPIAVRYAWADNPVCNLYNSSGLPAVPFRTDHWPGVTLNQR